MKSVAMFGYLRDGVGKSATKAIRNEGKVPCVLYGGSEHIHFSMYAADFKPLVYTPNTYKVKLDLNGKIYRAILKDIQFHPVNDSIVHADFQEINESKPVEMMIPVNLVGNSVGVRAGGKLIANSKKLRVRALPADLPDFIEVNIDNLEIGKAIKVGELSMDKITFLDTPNNPVVSVKTTRAAVEDAKAADADAKKK
ncbi:MAG: 50S ribosomal protein L25/general stress protein Ctc [Bacteroidota bacterium]|jgi:large subunit ribosomal protein L25|nr:50S ribosomal protein L25/general stress protein Ctc [Sphingobacteriales bacterium]